MRTTDARVPRSRFIMQSPPRSFTAFVAFFVCSVFLHSASADTTPVFAKHGMVVSAEPHATDAGVEILKAGGNAFDAAAAVAFALAVTYPEAGNLGGGGFAVALTSEGERWALDFREVAPAAATRDMYLDEQKKVIEGLSLRSHLAVGVPGAVDGYLKMAERGRLDRKAILAPAIRLAREGIPVRYSLHKGLASSADFMQKHPGTAAVFYPGGEPLEFGATLRQPDLARTLREISRKGRAGYYEGKVAELIEAEMKRGGGLIKREDIENYRSVEREPFGFRAGEYEVFTHPLPSSGGIVLAQIFGLIDLDELKAAGHNSARYIQMLTEAERLAYADRNYYLGDPAFATVPVERLISPEYLAERKQLIPPAGQAGKSEGVAHGRIESPETTHFCVADRWGNVVAVTTTLNGSFGMGAVVEGAGFLLNNEMDDFAAKPGVPNLYGLVGAEANAIEPGKRPLSSMTPTIVLKDGEFFMTVGSPGGSTIITTVLQLFLNATLFDMNIRDAIEAGRVHHQWLPDVITHERLALSPDTKNRLVDWGYELNTVESIGMAAGIMAGPDGLLTGHADGRGEGKAAGH